MAEKLGLLVVYKDEAAAEFFQKQIEERNSRAGEDSPRVEILAISEKSWDLKKKNPPILNKTLFLGALKDTEALQCFVDVRYERWGIKYGANSKYAVITADTVFVRDSARYNAFLEDYNQKILPAPESRDPSEISDSIPEDPVPQTGKNHSKVAKTFGTVGLAVATGGASLAAQKLYDDNKVLAEKSRQLLFFGISHFIENCLDDFLSA